MKEGINNAVSMVFHELISSSKTLICRCFVTLNHKVDNRSRPRSDLLAGFCSWILIPKRSVSVIHKSFNFTLTLKLCDGYARYSHRWPTK